MKNPGRMENVTRRLVATLLSLSMVILFASASQAAINCTQCHGNGSTSALPKDTHAASASYRNISTGAVMGNHSTHSGLVATGGPCARCHGAAAASYASNHAVLKHYSIQMSASMNYSKGTAFKQTATPTLGTCSTVNCHFQTITPTWGQATPWAAGKLAGDNNANCNTCHLTTALTSGAHAKHITAGGGTQVSCSQCHPDYNAAVGTVAFKHATSNTGQIKISFAGAPTGAGTAASLRTGSTFLPSAATNSVATCSTTYCHGTAASPAWTGGTTNCESCHDAKNTGLSTRHDRHYNFATAPTVLAGGTDNHQAGAYVYACLNCHPTGTHAAGPATGVYDAQVLTTGKMSGYTPAGTSLTDAKGFKYSNYGTCTTVCHTRDGVSLAPIVAASWGTAASGSCAVCHKASGESYATMVSNGATGLSAKHNLHMANDRYGLNTTNYTCAACHAGTATDNITINGASGRNQHPNANRDVSMSAFATGASLVLGGSQGSQTCTNTYCHGNGQSQNPSGGSAINWTSGSMPADCTGCHGGNAASASRIISRVHAQHLFSSARVGKAVGCADCHKATVSADTTVASYTNHVDKLVNVKFDNVINKDTDSPTYVSGTPTTAAVGATKLPGAAGYTCANVYCHSYGNVNSAGTAVPPTTYVSVAWTPAAIGCDGCHGGGGKSHPTYANGGAATQTANSHIKHVENNAFSCDYCHFNTVTQATIPPTKLRMNDYSGHLNRDVNIRLKLNGGATGTYNKTAKTCSSTYCHGGPPGPAWGANGSTNCATCHSGNNVLPGAHQAHVQTASLATSYANMSGNVSTATLYRFSCAACHSYAAGSLHVNGLANANGPAQVLYGFTSATRKATTYNYDTSSAGADPTQGMSYTAGGSGTCATTYCHSDGNGGIGDKTAFTWATPSPTNRLRCFGCHGSQDWKQAGAQSAQNYSSIRTNAHARHVRGDINTELNSGNGLTCNRCHGATISAAMNSYSTVGAGVLNKRRHVNKMRDYSGVTPNPNGGPVVSSGQFNPTTHQCSNVYCHSNSKAKNPRVGKFANPDAWNSGVTLRKCNYCHGRQGHGTPVAFDSDSNFSRYSSTGVPNYTSGMAGYSTANSHRQHMASMGTTDYSNTNVCYSCHSATLDSTTGKSASAAKFRAYSSRHTSGAYNVKMKAAYGGSYTGTMGVKTCSATLCHGGVSPSWGANTANDSCTKCHGTPSVTVTATTKYLVAPPVNTSQVSGTATGTGQVSNNPKVGAHQTHIQYLNGFSNYSTQTFMCENCHGTTLPTDTAHITGSSAPAFQRMANNRGAMGPTWTAASLTCSNVYCHNPAGTGGTLNTGNVGTRVFVSWTAATYLGDTAKTETNCNRCHKAPGTTAGAILLSGASNHAGVKIADDCSGCHGHNGNTVGVAGRRHIDGIKYGGGGTACNGCHSYDSADWSGASHNFGGQAQGIGAHVKHINHLKSRLGIVLDPTADYAVGFGLGNAAAVCGVCHTNTLGNHSTGDSTAARTIDFNGVATYKFGPNAPAYNGVYNSSSATNPKSCSNVSCHYFTSPNWSAY